MDANDDLGIPVTEAGGEPGTRRPMARQLAIAAVLGIGGTFVSAAAGAIFLAFFSPGSDYLAPAFQFVVAPLVVAATCYLEGLLLRHWVDGFHSAPKLLLASSATYWACFLLIVYVLPWEPAHHLAALFVVTVAIPFLCTVGAFRGGARFRTACSPLRLLRYPLTLFLLSVFAIWSLSYCCELLYWGTSWHVVLSDGAIALNRHGPQVWNFGLQVRAPHGYGNPWRFDPNYDDMVWDLGFIRRMEGDFDVIALTLGPILALLAPITLCAWYCTVRRHRAGTCRRCGYNLTGNISGICPECGIPIVGAATREGASRPPAN